MVKHQSDLHHYHHSDSSRSPSIGSSSLSPQNSSSTVANKTTSSTAAAVPTGPSTITLNDIDPQIAQHVEYELGLTKKNGSGTRKNAWGNLSYAELISKAITTSAEQRLTLSEIYDWMIKYVPFFRNKVDRASSAGWKVIIKNKKFLLKYFLIIIFFSIFFKNSIRHNLSLHNRFKRIQSEGTGKSSWWIINPDDKSTSPNLTNETLSSTNGIKQPRRRLGQTHKSSTTTPKRLRTPRITLKSSRKLTTNQRQQESTNHQIPPPDLSSVPVYDTQQWSTQLDSDPTVNHLYEHDLYSTSVNTPITNNNSTGGIQSTYPFDDISTNYVSNTSSHPNNTSDYSYHHHHHHHPHHFHHHQPHTLYQHHHGSNYDTGSNNGYYHQQPVLNDHHLLPMDIYHTNNGLTYPLQQPQQQPQQQQIDPNDDQHTYLRVHSTSSHSSSSSLSPPMITTNNNNLTSSSSSASSSSSYSYPHKNSSLSSSGGGYLHPNSNGTLTLYSHHHQQHHSDIETLLQLDGIDEEEDDDDLLTLVHHHDGMIDDHQQLSSFLPSNNHQLFSHNEPSTSILRTVLKRPIVGKN